MNLYIWGIIIVAIILLALIILILRRMIRKRKLKKQNILIPEQILNDFIKAEEQMKGGIENGTNPNPYQILWSIARKNSKPKYYSGVFSKDRINSGTNQQPDNQQYDVERQGGTPERDNIQAETTPVAGTEERYTKRRFQPTPPTNI